MALDPKVVEEFVGNAHGSLERVQELLAKEPGLVNAAWDWGGGDWETGLGAAAHMGRRDIAEYLLGRGARMDLFAAAMLGKLAVVQALVADTPALRDSRGPHGIPLLAHAKTGGVDAAAVVTFLESRETPNVTQLAPMLPARDVEAAVAYYTQRLGFGLDFRYGEPALYAGLSRGPAHVHLSHTDGDSVAAQTSVYLFVEDADALHAEYKSRGVERLSAPEVKPWGLKEFTARDLDGACLHFGEIVM